VIHVKRRLGGDAQRRGDPVRRQDDDPRWSIGSIKRPVQEVCLPVGTFPEQTSYKPAATIC